MKPDRSILFNGSFVKSRGFRAVVLITMVMAGLSVLLGRFPEPYFTSLSDIKNSAMVSQIIIDIRLPRVLMAIMLGMVLAASGTVFQMIFRNPLMDSHFLGVTGGAAFGASLGIAFFGGSVYAVQINAVAFALLGLVASYAIAVRIRFGDWVLRLVLSGIAITAIYTAGAGILKYLADPLKELPEMTFWLLGGLWGIVWTDTLQVMAVAIPCLTIIWLMRWRLNLLSMQDETVFSMVAAPGKERGVLLLAAVIATAVVVSKSGQINWVGLITPHIARRIVGSEAHRTLPCAILLGGLFVLLCDNVSRTVLSGEIPLGILTSLIGAGLFIGLLMNRRSIILK